MKTTKHVVLGYFYKKRGPHEGGLGFWTRLKCETDPAEPWRDEKAWRRENNSKNVWIYVGAEVPADQGREDLAVTMEDLAPIADAKFRELYPREILSEA